MQEACEHEITKRVMEKSIYYGSVLGTSLYLIWIAWMPLLHVSTFGHQREYIHASA